MMGNMGNMGNMDIIPKIQDLLQKAFVFAKLGLREEPGLGEKTNKPPLAKNRARTKERAERTPPGAKAGSEIIISLGINEERGRSQGGHRGTGSTTNPTFRNPVLAPGSQGDDIENIVYIYIYIYIYSQRRRRNDLNIYVEIGITIDNVLNSK